MNKIKPKRFPFTINNVQSNDDIDMFFMSVALEEAKTSLKCGDFPIGAVLVDEYHYLGKERSSAFTDTSWVSHAEMKLFSKYSPYLLGTYRANPNRYLCLYTTMEPCIMCFGASILHRVSRIVIACPDPNAGISSVFACNSNVGIFYKSRVPKIEFGILGKRSCALMIEFSKMGISESSENIYKTFTALEATLK